MTSSYPTCGARTKCRRRGLASCSDWHDTADLLDLHGGVDAYRAYLWEVQVGRQVGPDDFGPDRFRSPAATGATPARRESLARPTLEPSRVLAEVAEPEYSARLLECP